MTISLVGMTRRVVLTFFNQRWRWFAGVSDHDEGEGTRTNHCRAVDPVVLER